MSNLDRGLRKAAILIDLLDPASADALLERMSNESTDRIRRALLQLEPVEPGERHQILEELHDCRSSSFQRDDSKAGGSEEGDSQVSRRGAGIVGDQPEMAADGRKGDQLPEGRTLDRSDCSAQALDSAAHRPPRSHLLS